MRLQNPCSFLQEESTRVFGNGLVWKERSRSSRSEGCYLQQTWGITQAPNYFTPFLPRAIPKALPFGIRGKHSNGLSFLLMKLNYSSQLCQIQSYQCEPKPHPLQIAQEHLLKNQLGLINHHSQHLYGSLSALRNDAVRN